MKNSLQKSLFEKYPKIFRQVNLPMNQTCMCWGIECGTGWYNIIDNLCEQIQSYVDTNNCPQVEATQVKEKYGGLRVYVTHEDDYIENLIEEAEKKSYQTCEFCGTTENIGHTQEWIITLCETCAKKRPELTWKRAK